MAAMEYVIDASAVTEALIAGQFTENARALFRSLSQNTLIIPEFCLVECTNVIWKQVRFSGMPVEQANGLLRDLNGLPLKRVPVKRLLIHALRIGIVHRLAIYDALYIALAKRLNRPLITLDEAQLRAALAEGVVGKHISDFG